MWRWAVGLALVAVAGAAAYVRLAPSDPARWHVDLTAPDLPANAAVFCIRPGDRYDGLTSKPHLLADLDRVALATPRTVQLAGSVAEGRITWITRSALFGFPDYTTARVLDGSRFCVVGRQRFGSMDWGVNPRRISRWMQEVLGVPEAPEMTGL